MSSQDLDYPDCRGLLLELKNALGIDDLPSTIWGCVWLSDIPKLRELIDILRNLPQRARLPLVKGLADTRLVDICKSSYYWKFV